MFFLWENIIYSKPALLFRYPMFYRFIRKLKNKKQDIKEKKVIVILVYLGLSFNKFVTCFYSDGRVSAPFCTTITKTLFSILHIITSHSLFFKPSFVEKTDRLLLYLIFSISLSSRKYIKCDYPMFFLPFNVTFLLGYLSLSLTCHDQRLRK